MEVILLEDIAKLGSLGDQVSVKSGYGRNYLIPQKKAVPAIPENVKLFAERRAELEQIAQEKLAVARERAEQINALSVSIAASVGSEGKLFGSITLRDIAAAVNDRHDIEVEKSEIRLPQGPLRELGEYEIDIYLHPEVNAVLKLAVVAEA